jgi:polyisoprenoid-binding protein YceI
MDAATPSPSVDVETLVRDARGTWSLDPAASAVEFHVKHFWGVITVHGHFERIAGEGTVDEAGNISGELRIDAGSLTTKNAKRDQHLHSAEFFDVEHYPTVVVTVRRLVPEGRGVLKGQVTLEAGGHSEELAPIVEVVGATANTVSLRAEVVVDRTAFGMTWSPLKMASSEARAVVNTRFVRS